MGWWGYDIMDGDTPLDIKDFFDRAIPETVTADFLYDFAFTQQKNGLKSNSHLPWQVIGYFILENGYPMSKKLQDMIIFACDLELDDVESFGWCEPHERRYYLTNFRKRIENYELT